MTERYDVVVVGGGPAGSLTAALIRRQDPDRRVLVIERERFPRHHVGESTIPSWTPVLERAGVLPLLERSIPIRKIGGRFHWGTSAEQSWSLDFRESDGCTRRGGFHVDRAQFDQLLLEHARACGAEVREEVQVTDVRPEDGARRVLLRGPSGEGSVVADWVIDASGQSRALGRMLGTSHHAFDDMNNFAVWGYWRGSEILRHGAPARDGERWTYIATAPDGWVWHIPIAEDLVSVGLVTDKASLPSGGEGEIEAFYRRNLEATEVVSDLLRDAQLTQHPLAPRRILTIRDWSYRAERLCGPGWFLVGDAGLFVDPILSTGLLLASNGASMAANALHTIWNDPGVDVDLLFTSYHEAYADVGESFHRLATVWYSRNFKSSTWHWEAKRQRLRAGGNPAAETDAEAFLTLAMGGLADPLSGLERHPLKSSSEVRLDVRIMAQHLFGSSSGTELADAPFETDLAAGLGERMLDRWRTLLTQRLALRGCEWRRLERYFTAPTSARWDRVAFLELRAEGAKDPFDRLVLPLEGGTTELFLARLDGRAPLSEVLRALRDEAGPATLRLLRDHVMQLDLRGWLVRRDEAEPSLDGAATARALLEALVTATHNRGRGSVEVDLLGTRIVARVDGDPGQVLLEELRPGARSFAQTASSCVSYTGDFARQKPLLDVIVAALRDWERASPTLVDQLWRSIVPRVAGLRRDA